MKKNKNKEKIDLILDRLIILCSTCAIVLVIPKALKLLAGLNIFGISIITASVLGLSISLGLLTKCISLKKEYDNIDKTLENENCEIARKQLYVVKNNEYTNKNTQQITPNKYDYLFDNNYNDGEIYYKENSKYTRKRSKGKYLK